MGRLGGKDAFGPEAIQRQLGRLGRLGLKSTYRKLDVTNAFVAMRQVVGELVAAESIDLRDVPFILRYAGVFAPAIKTMPSLPRPKGVPRPVIPTPFHSGNSSTWRAKASEDAIAATVQGYVVLAATAVHKRRHFREEWMVEQYSGPDYRVVDADLYSQLRRLPSVVIFAGIDPLYEDAAKGAVVHAIPDPAGSVGDYVVMLCPVIAATLGWCQAAGNPFKYFDAEGQLVAQTLRWRDGGMQSKVSDTTVIGCGNLLLLREHRVEELRPFLPASQISIAWRVVRAAGKGEPVVTSGSRKNTLA
jgi:hypothetical protein